MCFTKMAKKEADKPSALNIAFKIAVIVGVVVALYYAAKCFCKKHNIKCALLNPCRCGCDDDFDEFDDYFDIEDDDCACCGEDKCCGEDEDECPDESCQCDAGNEQTDAE